MKKTSCITILFLILATYPVISQSLADKQFISGSWLGKISTGAVQIRIIFNLSIIERDSLVATLDSPDQGAKDIKLGMVTYDGKALKITAGALLAEYNGTLKNDTLIEGTWKQAGNSIEVNLTRLKTAFSLKRPQEPKPPFPYISEDVTFKNEKFNIELAGTLTVPEGKGPFTAVIMITGSGAQNRNEELLGHKPFLVIADHLTRNGIAVLRYDDRGVGKSQGDFITATSADMATDAEAAYYFLKNDPRIDKNSIGLAGHSEGGLIAPIVASSNPGIGFIISLAGPGVIGEKIIHRQNIDISLASGADEKDVRESISINKKLFAVLIKEPDNRKAETKLSEEYERILNKKKMSAEEIEAALKQLKTGLNPATYEWFRYFISTNPAVFWKRVKCPALALNGEKDLQVAPDINLKAIEKALRSGGNKSIKTIEFPGLNHLFQHCKTGLPAEYGEIEETVSPEVLKVISDWIRGL
jgi:pimeloyl-ACP methyl ester carboxylesterase